MVKVKIREKKKKKRRHCGSQTKDFFPKEAAVTALRSIKL